VQPRKTKPRFATTVQTLAEAVEALGAATADQISAWIHTRYGLVPKATLYRLLGQAVEVGHLDFLEVDGHRVYYTPDKDMLILGPKRVRAQTLPANLQAALAQFAAKQVRKDARLLVVVRVQPE
jgi:Fe2+ or Zn2+ uptake regulation protein